MGNLCVAYILRIGGIGEVCVFNFCESSISCYYYYNNRKHFAILIFANWWKISDTSGNNHREA